jgi:hypothetical protein
VDEMILPLTNWDASRNGCWKPPRMSRRVLPKRIFPKSALRGSPLIVTPGSRDARPSTVAAAPARLNIEMSACRRTNGSARAYVIGEKRRSTREASRRGEKKTVFRNGAAPWSAARLPRPDAALM